MDRTAASKHLSYVLRHHPESIGVTLDENGWIDIATLLRALHAHGRPLTRDELEDLVRTSDKQRFAIDGDRIRANQGHSVDVDLAVKPTKPPDVLYHGTVDRFLDSIRAQGLIKGSRTHVHLSADRATAINVGGRRGKPVVLEINAAAMHGERIEFFVSNNGVWLVEHVPARFLRFP